MWLRRRVRRLDEADWISQQDLVSRDFWEGVMQNKPGGLKTLDGETVVLGMYKGLF